MHLIPLSVLLLLSLSSTGQDSLDTDSSIAYLEDIEIMAYRVPIVGKTAKERKEQTLKRQEELIALPPISYSETEMENYEQIIAQEWHSQDSLRSDTLLSDSDWRRRLMEHIRYPKEAIKREMEASLTIQFDVQDGQHIQNVRLVQGNVPTFVLAVFEQLNQMPRMTFYEGFYANHHPTTKMQLSIHFNLK